MKHNVLIVGDNLLANYVCAQVSESIEIVHCLEVPDVFPEGLELALVCHDSWYSTREVEETFRNCGITWLRAMVDFGRGIVGPLVNSDTIGCSECADFRRRMASLDRRELWQIDGFRTGHEQLTDASASHSGLLQMAYLISEEVDRYLNGGPIRTDGHLLFINLSSLAISRHAYLPNPFCDICGHLPNDSEEAAILTLQSSPKVSPSSFRCKSIDELRNFLARDYLDFRSGLLNGKMDDLISPFATVSVNLPLTTGDEATAGRTMSYAESELTAILEGLERYCGYTPRGKRIAVRASFRDLNHLALNPASVGFHAAEAYYQPDFPFDPFHEDRILDWVWGYSLTENRAILVPERLAYYSFGCHGGGFVYETSNGCALGGSLEEAIFYGMMEVVERDAFLLTWYAELPLPRLNAQSANDRELDLMLLNLRTQAGYDVHLFNATMENGIPCVFAIAKNRKASGANLICAAGAHLNPVRAAKSAIHELAGMMLTLDEKFAASRDHCLEMYRDATRVREMEDHSMLYSLPEAEERLHFLLHNTRPVQSFQEAFVHRDSSLDLTDDLKGLVETFRGLGLDVIVVNQTPSELSRNGLSCVKVLIPGMLPMTFGYHLTRLEGLTRVFTVPRDLGYVSNPLTRDELNPHPHPFP